MRHAPDKSQRIVLDAPGIFIELLYARAVLDLDVAPGLPAASADVPEHVIAPPGADDRWRAMYTSALDQFERFDNVALRWLALDDASVLSPELAREWINEQRQRVIAGALMATKENGPRLERREQSIAGGPITHVLVLPVAGPYNDRPTGHLLVTSLDTFLEDDAWQAAICQRRTGTDPVATVWD